MLRLRSLRVVVVFCVLFFRFINYYDYVFFEGLLWLIFFDVLIKVGKVFWFVMLFENCF